MCAGEVSALCLPDESRAICLRKRLTLTPSTLPPPPPTRKNYRRVTTIKLRRCTRIIAPSIAILLHVSILAVSFWVGEASRRATRGP